LRIINIEKIPTPVWLERDGGPYVGTGCMAVMKGSRHGLAQLRMLRFKTGGDLSSSEVFATSVSVLVLVVIRAGCAILLLLKR
jgi:hypothetical protein